MDSNGLGLRGSLIVEEEGLEWCYPPGLQNSSTPRTVTGSPSSSSSYTTPKQFLSPPSPLTPPLPPALLIRTPPASPQPTGIAQPDGGDICPDTSHRPSTSPSQWVCDDTGLDPYLVCDCHYDHTDGVVSTLLIDSIKTASLHLLGIVIYQYWKEQCYGCQVNHPSQKHHECLTSIPEWFYGEHFDKLMKRLLNKKFVSVVRRFLTLKRVSADDSRIRGVAETVLYELKSAEDVTAKIREMYDASVGDDVVKVAQIREIGDYWRDFYKS